MTSLTVAKRSLAYMLIFFLGWFPAIPTAIYELFVGPVIEVFSSCALNPDVDRVLAP